MKLEYSWEQILRFLHVHTAYKARLDDCSDFYTWYDLDDWYIYNPEFDAFFIFNFKTNKHWIIECSLEHFSKKKGMFIVERLNKDEKIFINNSIKELMDDNKEKW